MYCLKKEQECITSFENSKPKVLNLIIHDGDFLNGFKISDIDQLTLAQIFRFGVILV